MSVRDARFHGCGWGWRHIELENGCGGDGLPMRVGWRGNGGLVCVAGELGGEVFHLGAGVCGGAVGAQAWGVAALVGVERF